MKYGIGIPQIWMMLGGIKDPVKAYETMTRVAQTADECGYETVWLSDHFHYGGMGAAVVPPSEDLMFECWTTTAAVARDTTRVRIAQSVTCNGYRNPALLAKMASTVDVLDHHPDLLLKVKTAFELQIAGDERWQIQMALGDLDQSRGEQVLAGQAYAQAVSAIQELAEKIEDEALRTRFLTAPQVRHILEQAA